MALPKVFFQPKLYNKLRDLKVIGLSLLILYGCGVQQSKSVREDKFRLLTYNVLTGFQKNTHQVDRFVEWVKDKNFDMIGFQEMSTFTKDSLARLAKRYGHPYAVLLKGNNSPIGITSKYPILNVKKIIDSMHHGCIYAEVEDFNVFVTHLSPFSYQKCIQEMKGILKMAAVLSEKKKTLIFGDFNSFSPVDGAYYQQKNRYAVIQSLLDDGFTDTYMQLHHKFEGSFPTIKYVQKLKKPTRIDYVFANKTALKLLVDTKFIKDSITNNLSDHYPLMVEFNN
jgi:exodeoxyribonuclease-3